MSTEKMLLTDECVYLARKDTEEETLGQGRLSLLSPLQDLNRIFNLKTLNLFSNPKKFLLYCRITAKFLSIHPCDFRKKQIS